RRVSLSGCGHRVLRFNLCAGRAAGCGQAALSLPGGNQLTITDERPTSVMTTPRAGPAPLGLAAFALATFLLSAANAHWMTTATGDAWLGYAFAYGGLAQFAAGMLGFRHRNVVGPPPPGDSGRVL